MFIIIIYVYNINICFYGLTFKPDVDDIRESPAIQIAEEILRIHKGKTFFIEPNLSEVILNNKKYNITGMLVYLRERFIQVLEGDYEAVNKVYNTIFFFIIPVF